MTDPQDLVENLLHDIPAKGQSMIEDNPDLAAAIQHFLNLKRDDDPRVKGVTLTWFYNNKLRDAFDGPRWFGTVRKYVREVLKRDPKTGREL